jgi:hypothetical protein
MKSVEIMAGQFEDGVDEEIRGLSSEEAADEMGFSKLDIDADGLVSLAEMQETFAKMDANEDGMLSLAEIKESSEKMDAWREVAGVFANTQGETDWSPTEFQNSIAGMTPTQQRAAIRALPSDQQRSAERQQNRGYMQRQTDTRTQHNRQEAGHQNTRNWNDLANQRHRQHLGGQNQHRRNNVQHNQNRATGNGAIGHTGAHGAREGNGHNA